MAHTQNNIESVRGSQEVFEKVIVQRMVHEGMGEKSQVSPCLPSLTEGAWPGWLPHW